MDTNSRRRAVSSRVENRSTNTKIGDNQPEQTKTSVRSMKELVPELTMEILEQIQAVKEKFNRKVNSNQLSFDKIYLRGDILHYHNRSPNNQQQILQVPSEFYSLYWQTKYQVMKFKNSYLEDCIASAVENALQIGRKQEDYYDKLIQKYTDQQQKLKFDLDAERTKVIEANFNLEALEAKINMLTNQMLALDKKNKTQLALKNIQIDAYQQIKEYLQISTNKGHKQILKKLTQIQKQLKTFEKQFDKKILQNQKNTECKISKSQEKKIRKEVEQSIKNTYIQEYLMTIDNLKQQLSWHKNYKMFRKQQIKDLIKYSSYLSIELQDLQQQNRKIMSRLNREQSCYITSFPDIQIDCPSDSNSSRNPSIIITYIEPANPEQHPNFDPHRSIIF